jgi:glycosyltransferase involved in cell wall biosynthesis
MTADTIGGVWTYAITICRVLDNLGCRIVLATMGPPPTPEQRCQAGRLKNVVLRESTFKLEWMHEPWQEVEEAGGWLLELEREFNPDIIHLNGYVHAAIPWSAPVIVVAHSCVHSWWRSVKGGPPPPDWDLYRERVKRGLSSADFVVAPSYWMLESLNTCYGSPGEAGVIWNGLEASAFQPVSKLPYIISAGRLWDEAKNVQALLRVAPRIDWPVLLAGEKTCPDGQTVQFENVTFLGKLTPARLRHRFAEASIFALPARYEPFGLTPLEAALSGCALVLGDIPSLREIWEDSALFVHPDDTEQLAGVLQHLISDHRLCNRFAERAHTRAKEFNADRMVRSYLSLYDGVIKRAMICELQMEVAVCE